MLNQDKFLASLVTLLNTLREAHQAEAALVAGLQGHLGDIKFRGDTSRGVVEMLETITEVHELRAKSGQDLFESELFKFAEAELNAMQAVGFELPDMWDLDSLVQESNPQQEQSGAEAD